MSAARATSPRRPRRRRGALVHVSAIGADPEANPLMAAARARARRRSAPLSRARRSSGPRSCSGRRTISSTASPEWLGSAGASGDQRPSAKFQPVYVADVGRAVAAAALDPRRHGGKTYELGGPQVLTHARADGMGVRATGRGRRWSTCPIRSAALLPRFGWLPGRADHLGPMADAAAGQCRVARRQAGLEAFGIQPTPLAAVAGMARPLRPAARFRGRRVNLTATT